MSLSVKGIFSTTTASQMAFQRLPVPKDVEVTLRNFSRFRSSLIPTSLPKTASRMTELWTFGNSLVVQGHQQLINPNWLPSTALSCLFVCCCCQCRRFGCWHCLTVSPDGGHTQSQPRVVAVSYCRSLLVPYSLARCFTHFAGV